LPKFKVCKAPKQKTVVVVKLKSKKNSKKAGKEGDGDLIYPLH
jgi:hypothetical protein